jgi:hypothetical protein
VNLGGREEGKSSKRVATGREEKSRFSIRQGHLLALASPGNAATIAGQAKGGRRTPPPPPREIRAKPSTDLLAVRYNRDLPRARFYKKNYYGPTETNSL